MHRFAVGHLYSLAVPLTLVVVCYTEKATEARHCQERQYNECANRKKQCRPNETSSCAVLAVVVRVVLVVRCTRVHTCGLDGVWGSSDGWLAVWVLA